MSTLLLPGGTRLLHIGPHKTGSTAVQVALFSAREALLDHGVYVPAGARRRREASEELFAARPKLTGPLPRWTAFAAEVEAAGDLRVCVSDELFGKARGRTARRIVQDLGGERTHVLAVARRYDAYLPSQWQERVKAGRTESYDDWLRIVLGDQPHWERQNVWTAHDTAALVNRWVRHVGVDRFTLVVAAEGNRDQLPRLFEELLGLPLGLLAPDEARSNPSLDLASVELIRRVNLALAERGLVPRDHRLVVNDVVRVVSGEHALSGGGRPLMPRWAVDRVRDLSTERAAAVEDLGVRVLGDPHDLQLPDVGEPHGNDLSMVTPELVTDTLMRVLHATRPR